MRNLFTALKQDTHANHDILENTFPFSIYHKNNLFDEKAYLAILKIMSKFHQTAANAVQQAELQVPALASVASMINSGVIEDALNQDIVALTRDSLTKDTHALNASNTAVSLNNEAYEDTHPNSLSTQLSNSPTSQAISAIYVWLGSSMGANIIVRRLDAMKPNIPTNYYQAMAGCAKAWVSFKQEVERLLPELDLENEGFIADAVTDANSWFNYLISQAEVVGHNSKAQAVAGK